MPMRQKLFSMANKSIIITHHPPQFLKPTEFNECQVRGLELHSVQFVHKNGKPRIIYIRNARFAHQFVCFIMAMIESCAHNYVFFTLQ